MGLLQNLSESLFFSVCLCLDVRLCYTRSLFTAHRTADISLVFPQVDCTRFPDGQPGVLFQVIDTGTGIGDRDYRILFDPALETSA